MGVVRIWSSRKVCGKFAEAAVWLQYTFLSEVGEIDFWAAFSSTTTNKEVAKGFSHGVAVYEIRNLPPIFGAPVVHLSKYPDEDEVLIAPGLKFEVIRHDKDKEGVKHWITLSPAPDHTASVQLESVQVQLCRL